MTKTLIDVAVAKIGGAATDKETTTETQMPRAEIRVVLRRTQIDCGRGKAHLERKLAPGAPCERPVCGCLLVISVMTGTLVHITFLDPYLAICSELAQRFLSWKFTKCQASHPRSDQ